MQAGKPSSYRLSHMGKTVPVPAERAQVAARMDKDENGTIGEAEGIAVGRAMQPQNPEGWWKMLLANSDNDKSNTVDLNEYIDLEDL